MRQLRQGSQHRLRSLLKVKRPRALDFRGCCNRAGGRRAVRPRASRMVPPLQQAYRRPLQSQHTAPLATPNAVFEASTPTSTGEGGVVDVGREDAPP